MEKAGVGRVRDACPAFGDSRRSGFFHFLSFMTCQSIAHNYARSPEKHYHHSLDMNNTKIRSKLLSLAHSRSRPRGVTGCLVCGNFVVPECCTTGGMQGFRREFQVFEYYVR